MISKAQLKDIKSLQLKKNRQQQQRFLIEGTKSVLELINSDFETEIILATQKFLTSHSSEIAEMQNLHEVSESQLQSVGTFKNNDSVLAVARMKANDPIFLDKKEFGIILDDVRDPGNVGTIIRIADWYGIHKIIVSLTTAEFYNPKVISSTMGSFTRVNIYSSDVSRYLIDDSNPVLGTFMEGENIHDFNSEGGWIVMGNESNGISKETEKLITSKISIPGYGNAESLNVAVATAIVCDNLKRQDASNR